MKLSYDKSHYCYPRLAHATYWDTAAGKAICEYEDI